MKNVKNSLWLILGVVLFAGAARVYAYPPDNAAVLYYKAMVLCDADEAMIKMLADFAKGDIGANDKIREFVKKSRSIKPILDAVEIKNCDWGLDFAEGPDMLLPHLGKMKRMSYLIAADARLLAENGKYEEALSRCMCLYRMARHANDKTLISYLVGNAIQKATNDIVIWILGQMPQDQQNLLRLKNQLAVIDSIPLSVKPGMECERDEIPKAIASGKTEDVLRVLDVCGVKEESFKNKIRSFDRAMIERNRQYAWDCGNRVRAAFDMPYPQGYAEITRLVQIVKEDEKTKPEAVFAAALVSTFDSSDAVVPHQNKVLSSAIRLDTQDHAIRTAIEVYLIKAQTGKLPEALPDGLPVDLFSDKPFVYEKAKNSFILRCQGKDLSKDEICQYEFKIK